MARINDSTTQTTSKERSTWSSRRDEPDARRVLGCGVREERDGMAHRLSGAPNVRVPRCGNGRFERKDAPEAVLVVRMRERRMDRAVVVAEEIDGVFKRPAMVEVEH
jgi:hypothetical protein